MRIRQRNREGLAWFSRGRAGIMIAPSGKEEGDGVKKPQATVGLKAERMGRKMTELEKMDAGLEYCFTDPEIAKRKDDAVKKCMEFQRVPSWDQAAQQKAAEKLFGSVGSNVSIQPGFQCDFGGNIHAGHNFLANYHVTILDIAPVYIGDDVMIGSNTLITTVGHPLSPLGRKRRMGVCKPVRVGNNVWIGGNVTILPGVTIGDNAINAAGAVVTKDVPDNCVAGGIPAKVIREIENAIPE